MAAQKAFQATNGLNQHSAMALGDFGLLCTLLHLKELMLVHGLASMCEHMRKVLKPPFKTKLSRAKQALIRAPEWKAFTERVEACSKGPAANPKADELIKILREHFGRYKEAGQHTSVIVFTQFRTSVCELVDTISRLTDLKASPFVGQSNNSTKRKSDSKGDKVIEEEPESVAITGQNQKQQQEVVRKFRANLIDVLVATSIGEEGLDIGSVDLIVSFDALTSPVRMIQRFGRAGRKRSGKVICLVAEGKEKDTLTAGTAKSQRVHNLLRKNPHRLFLYQENPRMLPEGVSPVMTNYKFQIQSFRSSQIAGRSTSGRAKKGVTGNRKTNASENWKTIMKLSREEQEYFQSKLQCEEGFEFRIEDALCRPNIEHLRNHHLVEHSSRTLLLKRVLGFITLQTKGAKPWLTTQPAVTVHQAQEIDRRATDEFELEAEVDNDIRASPSPEVLSANNNKRFDQGKLDAGPSTSEVNANTVPSKASMGDFSMAVEEEEEPARFEEDFAIMSEGDQSLSDTGSIFGSTIPAPPGDKGQQVKHASGTCSICGSYSAQLVSCADCGVAVHASCVGHCTRERWRCDVCSCLSKHRKPTCALCSKGRTLGAMKLDAEGKRWVHISCAIYTRNALCSFGGPSSAASSITLEEQKHGGSEKCSFCGVSGGFVVCSDPCCTQVYHASCGIKAGLKFSFDRLYPSSYCKIHSEASRADSTPIRYAQRELVSENAEQLSSKPALPELPPATESLKKVHGSFHNAGESLSTSKTSANKTPAPIQSTKNPTQVAPHSTKATNSINLTLSSISTPITTNPAKPHKQNFSSSISAAQTSSCSFQETPVMNPQGGRRRNNIVDSDSDESNQSHSHSRSKANVSHPKAQSLDWACKRCTLSNNAASLSCEACGLRRPSSAVDTIRCKVCNDHGRPEVFLLCQAENVPPHGAHVDCVGLKGVPEGDWYCAEHSSNARSAESAARNDSVSGNRKDAGTGINAGKHRKKRRLKRMGDEGKGVLSRSCELFEQEADVSGSDSGDDLVADEDLDKDLEGFIVDEAEEEKGEGLSNDIYRRSLLDSATPTPRLLKRGRALCVDMPIIANELKRLKSQQSSNTLACTNASDSCSKHTPVPAPSAPSSMENHSSVGQKPARRESVGMSQNVRQRIEENKRKALQIRQRKAMLKHHQQEQLRSQPQATIDPTQIEPVSTIWCRPPSSSSSGTAHATLSLLSSNVTGVNSCVKDNLLLQGADVVVGSRSCVVLGEVADLQSGRLDAQIFALKELYRDVVVCASLATCQPADATIMPLARGYRVLLMSSANEAVRAIIALAAAEDAKGFGLRTLDVDKVFCSIKRNSGLRSVLEFLCSARGMSVVVVGCLIKYFRNQSLGAMIAQMKPNVLMQAAPGLSKQQAALITSYFTRRCRT